jgi:hypothetical protein
MTILRGFFVVVQGGGKRSGGGFPGTKCRETESSLQERSKMLASCRAVRQTRASLLSFLLSPIVHIGLSPLAC